jgi:hypothetical protein
LVNLLTDFSDSLNAPPTVCWPWKCYAFSYPGRQAVAYSRNITRNFCLDAIVTKEYTREVIWEKIAADRLKVIEAQQKEIEALKNSVKRLPG